MPADFFDSHSSNTTKPTSGLSLGDYSSSDEEDDDSSRAPAPSTGQETANPAAAASSGLPMGKGILWTKCLIPNRKQIMKFTLSSCRLNTVFLVMFEAVKVSHSPIPGVLQTFYVRNFFADCNCREN